MKPLRPPTHRALSFAQLGKLAAAIEEIGQDGKVELEALLDLASELGVGPEKLLAALPQSQIELARSAPIRFEVCVGGCQEWGALEVTERLLDARDERADDGGTLFDIVPRACLDKCQAAAAVIVETGDGRAVIERATPAAIDEALESI